MGIRADGLHYVSHDSGNQSLNEMTAYKLQTQSAGNLYCFGKEQSHRILVQMTGEHELALLEQETVHIRRLCGSDDFCLLALPVENWNRDLSPWEAPAVFRQESFGGQAARTLQSVLELIRLQQEMNPGEEMHFYLGGYSLAGLFALWAVYQTDLFEGVAAASPSVWFPDFETYILANDIRTSAVYLSLGDREAKTKNVLMSRVDEQMQSIYKALAGRVKATFEWNEGNHFRQPDLRMAKGFAWLLK